MSFNRIYSRGLLPWISRGIFRAISFKPKLMMVLPEDNGLPLQDGNLAHAGMAATSDGLRLLPRGKPYRRMLRALHSSSGRKIRFNHIDLQDVLSRV